MKTHGQLKVDCFIEPMFQENAYLAWTADGPEAWIVDPGFPPQPDQIAAAVKKHGLTLAAIMVTHGHVDHIAGINGLRDVFSELSICAPRDEEHMLTDAQANLSSQIGMDVVAPPVDRALAPGDTLALGSLTWRALDVAGHSPGGLAYYCAEVGVVFTGDALFSGSIGRTDFPGSSTKLLLDNINQNLLTLPDQTVVYSGHGPPTTIARERAGNPFLRGGPHA